MEIEEIVEYKRENDKNIKFLKFKYKENNEYVFIELLDENYKVVSDFKFDPLWVIDQLKDISVFSEVLKSLIKFPNIQLHVIQNL